MMQLLVGPLPFLVSEGFPIAVSLELLPGTTIYSILHAYSTVFRSVPIASTFTSTTSPGFKNCGVFIAYPTPAPIVSIQSAVY